MGTFAIFKGKNSLDINFRDTRSENLTVTLLRMKIFLSVTSFLVIATLYSKFTY